MELLASHTDVIRDTVSRTFDQDVSDGYWYPIEPGQPLVRIYLATGSYQIERRRRPGAPWMPVVTAAAAEFDVSAFKVWRDRWPVVAN